MHNSVFKESMIKNLNEDIMYDLNEIETGNST